MIITGPSVLHHRSTHRFAALPVRTLMTLMRPSCGDWTVSAPTFLRQDVLVPIRFGAKTVWRGGWGADVFALTRFSAETFWRREISALGCFDGFVIFCEEMLIHSALNIGEDYVFL